MRGDLTFGSAAGMWGRSAPAQRQRELQHAHDELRDLLSSSGVALVLLDPDLRVRRLTAAASELLGLTDADVGRPLAQCAPLLDDPDLSADARRVMDGQANSERELCRRGGGSLLRRITPFRRSGGRADGVVIHLTDVTELKRSDDCHDLQRRHQETLAELRDVHDQLRAVDERKDELLATLGHELRNPLSGLHGGLALLDLDLPPERVTWTHQMMKRQVAQLISLLDDLLDISRIAHGKLRLRKRRTSVRPVVERAVASAHGLLEARRHCFVQRVDDLEVDADPTRLEQVVVNLLTNAAKFTPEGGHVELSVRAETDQLLLQVKDDGPGVPAAMRERIFEPFVQLPGERYGREGLGIGLALVKQLVEMHDGTTAIDSNGDRGAVFTVALPLAAPEATAEERPAPSQPWLTPNHTCRRVLLVEDKVELAEMLSLRLQREGLELRVATDGEAALTLVAEWLPDAMVIDIGLPTMSGIELARRVRSMAELADTVLIALSGYSHSQARSDAFEAGFDEHLPKPADCALLLRLLGHG